MGAGTWGTRPITDAVIPRGGPVLELGAGTGPVTEALIAEGCPVDEIIVVERDAELCRTLDRRFRGRLHVLHGDALDLGKIVKRAQILSVSVVLSGLPMRAVPRAALLSVKVLASLSVQRVTSWLRDQGVACRIAERERALCACLFARGGCGFIFLDASDDEAEQRFSLANELAHFLRHYTLRG